MPVDEGARIEGRAAKTTIRGGRYAPLKSMPSMSTERHSAGFTFGTDSQSSKTLPAGVVQTNLGGSEALYIQTRLDGPA